MKQLVFSWHVVTAVVSTVIFSGVAILLFRHVVFGSQSVFQVQSVSDRSQFVRTSHLLDPAASKAVTVDIPIRPQTALTFVGDIMLARSVEVWMRDEGMSYPFLQVPAIIGSSSAAIANFEAAIPVSHEHTAAYSTRFSADAKYVSELAKSGITHVSLANNHAFDFGLAADQNTRAVLAQNALIPFGSANTLGTSSITYLTLGTTTVAVLALQTVYGALDKTVLAKLIETMRQTSSLQIAYLHWGTEYQTVHSPAQATLAAYLVTEGIDVIIGHHPHVVEDVQLVQGVPVFYSLGNFIFDQYFSTAVQQGLTVQLELVAGKLLFTLVPVTSIGTHAQPRIMEGQERTLFLQNLAKRSDSALRTGIMSGSLLVSPAL